MVPLKNELESCWCKKLTEHLKIINLSLNAFFNKVVWFALAATLEGILLPSNMAAKTIFCLYPVKGLIVTLRCAVNVTTSYFQHFA